MYIYKITNKVNGKCYIGQTIRKVEYRWRQHCNTHAYKRSNSVIGKAIAKYQKENFTFEVIEECSAEDLDNREIFYIKFYNSIVPGGYNLDSGGNLNKKVSEETKQKIKNTRNRRPVISLNLKTQELNTYPSVLSASLTTEFSQTIIRNCCTGKWFQFKDYRWKYEDQFDFADCKSKTEKQRKPIKSKCLETGNIEYFESLRKADELGFNRELIKKVLKHKWKHYKNRIWAYAQDDFIH